MDNRELAGVIWLGAVLAACLIHRSTRSSVLAVLRAAGHPQILLPLLGLAGWVLVLVQTAQGLGLWAVDLLAPTIAWFLASGLVLLFNLERTWKSEGFLPSTMRRLIGVALFVGFFMNLFPLNLLAELMLQFLAVFLTLLALVAHRDVANKAVERMAEILLATMGSALALFTAIQLVRQWSVLDKRLLALELILPVWITIGILPFVYLMALYASYQSAFLRINHAVTTRRERARVKVAAIATFRNHLRDLNAFTFFWAKQAGEAKSLRAARQEIQGFRASKRLERADGREAQLRLVRNAGATGTDDTGRQLDQREFAETRRALHWLATCQMGWYRNRPEGYRADMLDVLNHDFTSHGLPADHGIELHVADDGESWWAGRRTVAGWCFAIGAAGPPPDQWEYDGSEQPSGFPGAHADWGDRPFSLDACANW